MSSSKPNVVMVTADSLRADHCGFLNPDADTTPVLDELANESGLTFTDAVSPGPRTASSMPEIVTGEHMRPPTTPLSDLETRINNVRTHINQYPTIAERFSEKGYTTLGFTTNPWTTTHSGFDAGFDIYKEVDSPNQQNIFRRLSEQVLGDGKVGTWSQLLDNWWNGYGMFSRWTSFGEDIFQKIERASRPYFLWVFLVDTHNPYLAPSEYRVEGSTLRTYQTLLKANEAVVESDSMSNLRGELPIGIHRGLKRAYRDCVRSVDGFVEQLVDRLDRNTIFAFHSDHGEAFGEHGTYGHQRTLYEENLHVPLLLCNPTMGWSNRDEVTQTVSLRKLPEILSAAAEDVALSSWEIGNGSTLISTEDCSDFAVRSDAWKYISADEELLYRLAEDPDEDQNLFTCSSRRYVARRDWLLENEKFEEVTRSNESDPSSTVMTRTVPSDVGERLSALGYSE